MGWVIGIILGLFLVAKLERGNPNSLINSVPQPKTPNFQGISTAINQSGDNFLAANSMVAGVPQSSAQISAASVPANIVIPVVQTELPPPLSIIDNPAQSAPQPVLTAPVSYSYQGYWPNGFTHYTDSAGNAIGPGAGNAPSYPAPTVVAI